MLHHPVPARCCGLLGQPGRGIVEGRDYPSLAALALGDRDQAAAPLHAHVLGPECCHLRPPQPAATAQVSQGLVVSLLELLRRGPVLRNVPPVPGG